MVKEDFVGFTFNDKHSSDLGIIRTSDGSRYNYDLLPTFQDVTLQVPGGDGTYYFGSHYTERQFPIPIAFDSLTEEKFRLLVDTFSTKELKRLIFDEAPYKYYMAKPSGTLQLKYICFDEGGVRIYKGEGTLNFVAYYPFAKSVHKFLNSYSAEDSTEKTEWNKYAKLLPNNNNNIYDGTGPSINLYNSGQLETDFYAYYSFVGTTIAATNIKISQDPNNRTLSFSSITKKGSDNHIRINSKTNLIEGCSNFDAPTGTLYNSSITSGDFFKIPLLASTFVSDGANCTKIEYDYLYR